MNTYLLKWIHKKNIEIEKINKKAVFIKYNSHTIRKISRPKDFEGDLERMYYELINNAFMNGDTISSNEFNHCMSENHSTIRAISASIKKNCLEFCYNKGWIIDPGTIKKRRRAGFLFHFICIVIILAAAAITGLGAVTFLIVYCILSVVISSGKKGSRKFLTPEGENVFDSILGFASYLYNYFLMERKETEYINFWDTHLAFANLVGISKDLRLEFLKKIPEKTDTNQGLIFMESDLFYTNSSGSSDSSGGSGDSGGGGGGSGGGGGGTR
jgi:hypothetical protein